MQMPAQDPLHSSFTDGRSDQVAPQHSLEFPAPAAARRLKVLHVITGLGPGGAETVLYRLVSKLTHVDHTIVSMLEPDWYSKRLSDAGSEVHHLGITSLARAIEGSSQLARIIRQTNPDIVQCWMYRANILGGLLGRLAGKRVVWNIRSSTLEPLRPASRLAGYVGGALARWVPDFVINCSVQSVEVHGRIGYNAVDGTVIPNGYDASVFHSDDVARAATREALGLKSSSFVIGAICRWHVQKGIPLLLDAVRALSDIGAPVTLLMAGRGINEGNDELRELIESKGCEGVVQLLGERTDIPDLARAFDLHVLASIGAEGFPNVVAETMMSGTPNVATDSGDSELVVGDTGWVVPRGDGAKLASAIHDAYEEWKSAPAKWEERRKAAEARIADKFSLEQMARAYEAVWMKVTRAELVAGVDGEP